MPLRSGHRRFGISGEQVAATVGTWRRQSAAVAAIDLGALDSVGGTSSSVMDELRATSEPAGAAVASIRARLEAMSTALQGFTAVVDEDDHATAQRFRDLPER